MKRLFYLGLFAILLSSCNNRRDELTTQIDDLYKKVYEEMTEPAERRQASAELIDLYEAFATEFPDDDLTPEYLFNAGEGAKGLQDYSRAIAFYDKIQAHYPDYKKAPMCLFLKGNIYDDGIGDKEMALNYYNEFIQKYPDHDFRDDAEFLVKNINKTDEEIIREFEEALKAAGDSSIQMNGEAL